MISIQTPSTPRQYTANVLPCRIKYTGPTDASPHLWNPQSTTTAIINPDDDDTSVENDQDQDQSNKQNVDSDTATNSKGQESSITTHTSYFRGRRLLGTRVQLPQGYTGHILAPSKPSTAATTTAAAATVLSQKQREAAARHLYGDEDDDEDDGQGVEDESEDEEDAIDVTNWESSAQFQDVMLWNHEVPVEVANDGIVRGIREWIGFSHVMHGLDAED